MAGLGAAWVVGREGVGFLKKLFSVVRSSLLSFATGEHEIVTST